MPLLLCCCLTFLSHRRKNKGKTPEVLALVLESFTSFLQIEYDNSTMYTDALDDVSGIPCTLPVYMVCDVLYFQYNLSVIYIYIYILMLIIQRSNYEFQRIL